MAGYSLLDEIISSSSGDTYQIRRGGDGVLYCHNESRGRVCQGWLGNKNRLRKQRSSEPASCKHTQRFVAEHPGTPYVIGEKVAPQFVAQAKAPKFPSATTKAGTPIASTPAVSSKPAPANWKDVFLAEQAAAHARGMVTPAAALAEFRAEVGRFANLDVDDGDAVVAAVKFGGRRALDVE